MNAPIFKSTELGKPERDDFVCELRRYVMDASVVKIHIHREAVDAAPAHSIDKQFVPSKEITVTIKIWTE